MCKTMKMETQDDDGLWHLIQLLTEILGIANSLQIHHYNLSSLLPDTLSNRPPAVFVISTLQLSRNSLSCFFKLSFTDTKDLSRCRTLSTIQHTPTCLATDLKQRQYSLEMRQRLEATRHWLVPPDSQNIILFMWLKHLDQIDVSQSWTTTSHCLISRHFFHHFHTNTKIFTDWNSLRYSLSSSFTRQWHTSHPKLHAPHVVYKTRNTILQNSTVITNLRCYLNYDRP